MAGVVLENSAMILAMTEVMVVQAHGLQVMVELVHV